MYVPLMPTALRDLQQHHRRGKEGRLRQAVANMGKIRLSVGHVQGNQPVSYQIHVAKLEMLCYILQAVSRMGPFEIS
jgi:hypothetical protein